MNSSNIPFKPCPDSPNCHITSIDLKGTMTQAKGAIKKVLQSMRAKQVKEIQNGFDAVFQVFVFLDDVTIRFTGSEQNPTLWIRSASRVGYSDLGVNKRRVNDILIRFKKEFA